MDHPTHTAPKVMGCSHFCVSSALDRVHHLVRILDCCGLPHLCNNRWGLLKAVPSSVMGAMNLAEIVNGQTGRKVCIFHGQEVMQSAFQLSCQKQCSIRTTGTARGVIAERGWFRCDTVRFEDRDSFLGTTSKGHPFVPS